MSDQLKQHIADMDDEKKRVEKDFFGIDSDLREVRSEVDPNSELAEKLKEAIEILEDDGGIKDKVERLHKEMDAVENGNLHKTPKKMSETIHSITDEAAAPQGERNKYSLGFLEAEIKEARKKANSGDIEGKIEEARKLVEDQFKTLRLLREEINQLVGSD